MLFTKKGLIFTKEGWVDGEITFDHSLLSVTGQSLGFFDEEDPKMKDSCKDKDWIIPGFVDLHVHGGLQADTMQGEDAVLTLARFHAQHGTAALAPTTMTARPDDVRFALDGIAKAQDQQDPEGAEILGAHLEGPFISPNCLGAQPALTEKPDLALLDSFLEKGAIVVATVAPELEGADLLIQRLSQAGCRVQVGHSLATAEQVKEARQHGCCGFTHLYNAMSGFHHREDGVVSAAFELGGSAELILDFNHCSRTAARIALEVLPQLHMVTDAMSAAGCPDGTYPLGVQSVFKKGSSAFLEDGTLAGSVLTMDQAFYNLLSLGVSVTEAVFRTSTFAADFIGRPEYGTLAVGSPASFLILNTDKTIQETYLKGQRIFITEGK